MNTVSRPGAADAGFTLAELAIVMVVIGLLIGGVLQGMSMIENARVKSVMSQVKYIDGAAAGYADKFSSMPGDHISALTRLRGCSSAEHCANGNGNRQVGEPVSDYTADDQAGSTGLPEVETSMFWKHLALAEFIIDIDITADPAAPSWSGTHPKASGFGGYSIFYATPTSGGIPHGHHVMLRKDVTGTPAPSEEGLGAVKPSVAEQIDTAMDDGLPNNGAIRAMGESCLDDTGNAYNGAALQENCIMIFKMHTF